jgi:MFS transporter, NNP family, nitrate/nitrite transporter
VKVFNFHHPFAIRSQGREQIAIMSIPNNNNDNNNNRRSRTTSSNSEGGHGPLLSASLGSYGSISSSSSPPLSLGGPSGSHTPQHVVVIEGPPATVPSQGMVSVSPLFHHGRPPQQQRQQRQNQKPYLIPPTQDTNKSIKKKTGNAIQHSEETTGLLLPASQDPTSPPLQRRTSNTFCVPTCCKTNEEDDDDDDDEDDLSNEENDDDNDDDGGASLLSSKDRLLQQTERFDLNHSPERGYRATEMNFLSMKRPHMRAMHASWICFFASNFVQYAMAPLLPQLQTSFHLTKRDIWLTNGWMMMGGVPMRFILGPLCDTYGPRQVMVWMLVLCAIPCALSGLVVMNLFTLILVRVMMGAMDAFVPCQCWITSHFVREVGGTIMAIAGGLGASGSGVTQLVVGVIFDFTVYQLNGGKDQHPHHHNSTKYKETEDLAWRITLLVPAAFAFLIAYLSYKYSDDCPLGNFMDVKKAGLMMQRSAVDSFRSGIYNFNSWLLFLQYAGSAGVDCTMCNGCAIYFHAVYSKSIATSGAIAFLYGISAVYARGLGGYISDRLYDNFALRGRLYIHFICMLAQGMLNIWFSRTADLQSSLIIMVVFSVLVQVSATKYICG